MKSRIDRIREKQQGGTEKITAVMVSGCCGLKPDCKYVNPHNPDHCTALDAYREGGCTCSISPTMAGPVRCGRHWRCPIHGKRAMEEAMPKRCTLPPEGWICTRAAGHPGPCAAVSEISAEGERVRREPDERRLLQLIEWATGLIDGSDVSTAYTSERTAEMREIAARLYRGDASWREHE